MKNNKREFSMYYLTFVVVEWVDVSTEKLMLTLSAAYA